MRQERKGSGRREATRRGEVEGKGAAPWREGKLRRAGVTVVEDGSVWLYEWMPGEPGPRAVHGVPGEAPAVTVGKWSVGKLLAVMLETSRRGRLVFPESPP